MPLFDERSSNPTLFFSPFSPFYTCRLRVAVLSVVMAMPSFYCSDGGVLKITTFIDDVWWECLFIVLQLSGKIMKEFGACFAY